ALHSFPTRRSFDLPDVICQAGDFIVTKRLLLLGIFGILMVISSVTIIRRRGELETEDSQFQHGLVILEGVLIGFLTGLVGAGGGFLIIPALVILTGFLFKTAVGSSLFIFPFFFLHVVL